VTVNPGGFLLPGYFNAGTLTVAGNVTLNSSPGNDEELFIIANSKSNFSQLVVTGTNNKVTLTGSGGGLPTVGISQNYHTSGTDDMLIISVTGSGGSVSGTFFATLLHNDLTNNGYSFGFKSLIYASATVTLHDPPTDGAGGTEAPSLTDASPGPVIVQTNPLGQDQIGILSQVLLAAVSDPKSLGVRAGETGSPSFGRAQTANVSAALATSGHADLLGAAVSGMGSVDPDLVDELAAALAGVDPEALAPAEIDAALRP
jgi:hypothetical protein